MPIPVPEPIPDQLVSKIKQLLEVNLTDPGYVLATGEYVGDTKVTARALRRDDPSVIHGIHVAYVGCSESNGIDEDEFFNTVTHRLKVRIFLRYEGDDVALDDNSKRRMLTSMWETAAVLRNNPSLGFGDDVEVDPIQMPDDIGEDETDKVLGTFIVCPIDVYVKHKVFAAYCG